MEQEKFNWVLLIAIIAGFIGTLALQGMTLTRPTGGGAGETYTITASGSTTCYPVVESAANIFMDNYTNYEIRVSSGGSSTGIKNAGTAASDIGMASRNIKSSENDTYNNNLIDWQFAADGIAIIIDADATHGVTNLTLEQLFLIYNGTYTNWDELGGSSATIDVVTRASGSGTRGTFEELVQYEGEELGENDGYESAVTTFHEEQENPLVASYVATHPNAIGYVGLGFVDDDHTLLPIDNITPSEATILDDSYPISRKLHLVTNGMPTAPVQLFIDFIFGPRGQVIVAEEGFIPLYSPR